ncbi:hypothetical protein BCY91_06780 [Pelobium manganitolerans]|uniref:MobA/VirD2-like nuclease domain-containing protein n=1 Tax=Pelobium manganitolerans TaxID=1842495 RepID=A0A419S515_9SPHI|nr:relaxase/mobilization nuclease domain-containing protein [Pelobium manganitolerans]RKD15212.1 hypothetical protein BCY91_06780 [Pelobium manganitolerans]
MVAKIISGKSLIGALNYNENKVHQGKAELIFQSGYAKDLIQLNFNDKLLRLKDLTLRNKRVKTNTVHISLNFSTNERLPPDLLGEIANEYMERIGFGNQPYLVYKHNDAAHPHVHIVSTNIKSSGERISLHNLGSTKSEEARQLLEEKFGLVQAGKNTKSQALDSSALNKVEYGKVDTKRALTNTINAVIKTYRFTSLPELNAVLQSYNVLADRGAKDSRMFASKGLLYWVVDNKGNKIGVPIKASSIYGRPTLKNLEERFKQNEELRKPLVEKLKPIIDGVLMTKASPRGFSQALINKGIQVVFRCNENNYLYGVTYVDHTNKVVCNGSDLGKKYTAAALNKYFQETPNTLPPREGLHSRSTSTGYISGSNTLSPQAPINQNSNKSLIEGLLQPDYSEVSTMRSVLQNRRKKKRKRLSK